MPGAEAERPANPGRWAQADLLGPSLPAARRLSLGEGDTALEPAPELGLALGIPSLWLKREDRSPTGSHKARSLGYLISLLLAQGRTQAVISSSGNAAIAAAAFADLAGIRLLSLVSPRTPAVKLRALAGHGQLVVESEHPVALLHHAVVAWGLADLRGSAHPLAAHAYREIAAELARGEPIEALFLYSSSGATLLGISQGFEDLQGAGAGPALHLVEGLPGGELSRPWYPGGHRGDPAPGLFELGARRSRLAPAVRRAVRRSGGRGWRVGGSELTPLRELAGRRGLETSWEGLATLAAMARAAGQGAGAGGRWVAVLTGAAWQLELSPAGAGELGLPRAESPGELDPLLERAGFLRPDPA